MALYSTNLCVNGNPIMGGAESGFPYTYAFDGNISTEWHGFQTGGAVEGNDWIGWSFDKPRHIRKINITQGDSNNFLSSIIVQRAASNSTKWSTVAIVNNLVSGSNEIVLPISGLSDSWRILANSVPVNKWAIKEIEMFEQTDYASYSYSEQISIDSNGSAIASSNVSNAKNAFDGSRLSFSIGTRWDSSETMANVKGKAWIGFAFNEERHVRQINLSQLATSDSILCDSYLIQSSSDQVNWNTIHTWNGLTLGNPSFDSVEIPESSPKKYWRLLANKDLSGSSSGLGIYELEMFEMLAAPQTPTPSIVGTSLPSPESGWKRYDSSHSNFKYKGLGWVHTTGESAGAFYNGTRSYTGVANNGSIHFKFTGRKIRVIVYGQSLASSNCKIRIDGVEEVFSSKPSSQTAMMVGYEKTNLSDAEHSVEIYGGTDGTHGIYFDAIDIDSSKEILPPPIQIGEPLTTPEAGWKRYDDTHPGIIYHQGISKGVTLTGASNNTYSNGTISSVGENAARFDFVGTKIRWIARINAYSNKVKVLIDGVEAGSANLNGSNGYQILVFEKTGLSEGKHTVKFVQNEVGQSINIDALDIDSTGRLLHPDEVTDIKDLTIGKRLRCNYKASTSGQVGTFSGLGQETADFIPPASSATPSGDFYFIMYEDWNGEKRLIADRNVQHSISWDKINESGIAGGSGLEILKPTNNIVPIMTSNTAPSPFKVIFSSEWSGATSEGAYAYRAFDKTDLEWFPVTSDAGEFVGIDFYSPKRVIKYSIKASNRSQGNMPFVNWKLQGSNDNSNWVDLDIKTNITWTIGEKKELTILNEQSFRYYRVYRHINKATTDCISEIEFFETLHEPKKDFSFTTRLLTGGTSSTDKDNEWDQYIVSSSLNGSITPGDNNVWNWINQYSWSSTVNASNAGQRIIRGYSAANGMTGFLSGNPTTTNGFRPVLTIESLEAPKVTKYLFEDNGEIKKWVKGAAGVISSTTAIPKMTSNTAPSGRAFAGSVYSASYDAWYAFNQNDDREGYASAFGSGGIGHLGYEFTTSKRIGKYAIRSMQESSYLNTMPKNWTFEGSNDGVAWKVMDTQSNQSWSTTNTDKEYIISVPEHFKMYRLNWTANFANSNYTEINELKIYEISESSPSYWQSLGPSPATEELFKGEGHSDFSEVNSSLVSSLSVPLQSRGTLGAGQWSSAAIKKKGITLKTGKVK